METSNSLVTSPSTDFGLHLEREQHGGTYEINRCSRGIELSSEWRGQSDLLDHDEEWLGNGLIEQPRLFTEAVREARLKRILFTSPRASVNSEPPFEGYQYDWDNAAVVPVRIFKAWWEGRSSGSAEERPPLGTAGRDNERSPVRR